MHNGNITKVHLTNGIYELDMKEITKISGKVEAADAPNDVEDAHAWAPDLHQHPPPEHEQQAPKEDPKVKSKPIPAKPSREDIERHNASGHVPFRSWCPLCVQGRGKEDGHKRVDNDSSDLPLFECGYHFMSSDPHAPWTRTPADDPKTQLKLLSLIHI